jgi:hypothetical protein
MRSTRARPPAFSALASRCCFPFDSRDRSAIGLDLYGCRAMFGRRSAQLGGDGRRTLEGRAHERPFFATWGWSGSSPWPRARHLGPCRLTAEEAARARRSIRQTMWRPLTPPRFRRSCPASPRPGNLTALPALVKANVRRAIVSRARVAGPHARLDVSRASCPTPGNLTGHARRSRRALLTPPIASPTIRQRAA